MKFEESLKQLEEIANKLENGDCDLDEAVKLYEKAVELSGECDKALNSAKLKLTQINTSEKD